MQKHGVYKILSFQSHFQSQNCFFHFILLPSDRRHPTRQCSRHYLISYSCEEHYISITTDHHFTLMTIKYASSSSIHSNSSQQCHHLPGAPKTVSCLHYQMHLYPLLTIMCKTLIFGKVPWSNF